MGKNLNIDRQKLLNAILNAKGKKINQNSINQAEKGDISGLVGSLSDEEKKSLKSALGNKSEVEKILNSDEAKEIIRKLSGK